MFERPNYSRRDCLAVLAAATAGSVLDAAPTPKVPGVQLYTVRALLKKDPDATLKALAGIGFRDVEGYDRAATVALAPTIKQNGLTVRSCQIETPLITNNWEPYPDLKPLTLPEAIDSVAGTGAEYFTMGYIAPGARGDGDDFYRRTADRMNTAAESCRKSGLKFAWQSHAFEFGRALGIRPIEIYKERLDPKLVGMELDVFWASVAGEDPVRLLKEWKGHVPLLRLGDKAKDAPHQFSETIGQGAFVGIGDGDIDIPAIRKAAAAAGVKYEFVGQDQTTGDPIESLRKSYARLS
jgi:sugar phosphate isomerase/epimerase